MIVEIKENQPQLGLKKGHWYIGEPYSIDPGSKITLLRRISKNGRKPFKTNPMCNQYRNDVKIIEFGNHNNLIN